MMQRDGVGNAWTMTEAPVTTQLGKYRLVARLGQGGMGTVYLALASGLGEFRKLLVVKELRRDLTRQEGFVTMFMDEAKLAARLDHPNVVQTFEASQEQGRYYLAMEFLDGQPFSALLDRLAAMPTLSGARGLPLHIHIHVLCEVLAGLQYAHELTDYQGQPLHVVHRDVSPHNVFLTYHGQVKVMDFGVAKAAGASSLTEPGVFKGKFAYAAPEQVMGRPVDGRADVFAIGIMLWQAIAGRPFSERAVTPASFRARAAGLEPRIRAVVPTLDPELARICDRALEVDPEARYTCAAEMRADLQQYMQSQRMRVDAAELGELLRSLFDNERREIHSLIEQAMHGSAVSGVEPLHAGDATAIVGLANVPDVSRERHAVHAVHAMMEEQLHPGYVHSKVLTRPGLESQSSVLSVLSHTRWLYASVALSCVCLLVMLVLLLTQRKSVTLSHLPTELTGTGSSAVEDVQTLQPSAAASGDSAQEPLPRGIAAEAVPRAEPVSTSREPSSGRSVPAKFSRRPTRTASRQTPDAQELPEVAAPAEKPASTEQQPSVLSGDVPMGTELKVDRPSSPRIDLEDPYR